MLTISQKAVQFGRYRQSLLRTESMVANRAAPSPVTMLNGRAFQRQRYLDGRAGARCAVDSDCGSRVAGSLRDARQALAH